MIRSTMFVAVATCGALAVALPTRVHAAAVPAPRTAVPAGPTAARTDAAQAFDAGEAAFAAGEYEAAVAAFAKAQRLMPHPSTAFNLGLALDKAGRSLEAWDTFDAIASASTDARIRAEAIAQRAEVERRLSLLRIEAAERALVCLDGAPYRPNVTARVKPGRHRVTVDGMPKDLHLGAGQHYIVTVGTPPRPQDVRRKPLIPLLGIAAAGSALSIGLGAGALATDNGGTQTALGFASVGFGVVALAASATAIGLHIRNQRPPPQPRAAQCGDPPPKPRT